MRTISSRVPWLASCPRSTEEENCARRFSCLSLALAGALLLLLTPSSALAVNELQVNSHSSGQQWEPAVATAKDRSFAVVWAGAGQDGDGYGILGRVFRRNGLSAGPEFRISEQSQGDQRTPSVGIDDTGRFVVAWVEEVAGSWRVKARRFAPFGKPCQVGDSPLGPEIVVAERALGASHVWRMVGLGVAPDGRFGVAWVDPYQYDDDRIFFRLFDAQDLPEPLTPAIQAPRYNTIGTGIMSDPKVAATSWGIQLAWLDDGASYGAWLGDLVTRRYSWEGDSLDTSTTLVDTLVEQGGIDVAVTPAETVVLVYRRRQELPVVDNNIYLAHYGASGLLHESPIQVNTGYYSWGQRLYNTGVGVAATGHNDEGEWGIIVVWNLRQYDKTTATDAILARHFIGATEPVPASADEVQLNTLGGTAQILWNQSPVGVGQNGVFRAVWWREDEESSVSGVYLRCGKLNASGIPQIQDCEHDADYDGVADRFDVDPNNPFVGYDLDRDGVPDGFLCGASKEDCVAYCEQEAPDQPGRSQYCAQNTCQIDNCIDGADQACSATRSCLESDNSESCFDPPNCEFLFSNAGQADSNLNGVGDKCEVLDADYYYGEPVDLEEEQEPLIGQTGKIAVYNLRVSPNPVIVSEQHASLLFDLDARVLPGLPSGQFRFTTNVVWQIKTANPTRTIVQERQLQELGVHPVEVPWDGNDETGTAVNAGVYIYQVTIELVRTKISTGKSKVFDTVISPWKTVHFGNGEKRLCYPARCDKDGDGYAAFYEADTPEESCMPVETNVSSRDICPTGYLQYPEPIECDRVEEIEHIDRVMRLRLSNVHGFWEKLLLVSHWMSDLANKHPRRLEVPDNYMDDDCDGKVDETEFWYRPWGTSVTHSSFEIQALVKNQLIKDNIDEIRFHVVRLADILAEINSNGASFYGIQDINALSEGRLSYLHMLHIGPVSYSLTVDVGPMVAEVSYPYSGESSVIVEVSGLPNSGEVYVVGLSYHSGGDQVFCVDAYTHALVTDPDPRLCAGINYANRLVSDVYLTATEEVDGHEDVVPIFRLRRLVANRAIYEWFLSQIGEVGGQHAQNPVWADGTRYGASYDERWCTEFVSAVYDWSTLGDFGHYSAVHQIVGYFDSQGQFDLGSSARMNIGYPDTASKRAMYGDYVPLNTKEHEVSTKNHSSIYLGTLRRFSPNATVQFLKIAGNEGRRVECNAVNPFADNDVGGYIVQGLGHLAGEVPTDNLY